MLEEKVLIKVLRECSKGNYPHSAAPDNKYVDALVEIGIITHEPYGNPDCELPISQRPMSFRSQHSNQCWQFVLIFPLCSREEFF